MTFRPRMANVGIYEEPKNPATNFDHLLATRNCPCEGCPDELGCRHECKNYKNWVINGKKPRTT